MTHVIFVEDDGSRHVVDADCADRALDVARNNGIAGIVGECGGELACATCHVWVDAAFVDKLPPPGEVEQELLECVFDQKESSRLSCQIRLSDDLDGLILYLPPRQV